MPLAAGAEAPGALRSPGLARGLTRDRVSAPGMPRVTGRGGGWSAQ